MDHPRSKDWRDIWLHTWLITVPIQTDDEFFEAGASLARTIEDFILDLDGQTTWNKSW